MPAPNTSAIFSRVADIQILESFGTAANVTVDITTSNVSLAYVADGENGGFIKEIRVKDLSTSGSSTATVVRFWLNDGKHVATLPHAGDTVSITGHQLEDGDTIRLTEFAGADELAPYVDTTLYVVNKAANTFQVATTLGGSPLLWTVDGSGTILYQIIKSKSRAWISTATSSSARSGLIGEISLPINTFSAVAQLPDFVWPAGFAIPPSWRIYATIGTVVGGNHELTLITMGSKY